MDKFVATLVACLIGTSLFASPANAWSSARDEAKIRTQLDQFVAAMNAKDVDAIMKFYVADESLVVFDLIPPRQYVGAAAYRKDYEGFLSSFNGPIKLEINDLSVTVDGKLAYTRRIDHLTGTDAKGKKVEIVARVTDVFRKIEGNWLIVHEHVSVPVDMATGKPDFASKP
jgi:ketosteroid isomerase-like protein